MDEDSFPALNIRDSFYHMVIQGIKAKEGGEAFSRILRGDEKYQGG